MKHRKNIFLMYAIVLLQGMVFYGPIATLYRQTHGITVFQITLIESISYLLCILFEIPWGIAADRIGYKRTMCVCCGLYFVSKIVFWRANGFFDFLLERILLSIVISGLSGVDTSILYLSCKEGESQKIFGIYNSLGMVGLLLAAFLFSAFVGDDYSLAAILTMVSYGAAAVLALLLDEVKDTEHTSVTFRQLWDTFVGILGDRHFLLLLISAAFLSETHQTIAVFLNQVQYKRCGMSDSVIGYVFIAATLAGLSGVFSDRLTRALGRRHTGTVLYYAAAAACMILGFTNSAILSVLAVLLLSVVEGLFQPFHTVLQNRQVRSENRATELSVYAMVINCVSAGTSAVFGALADVQLQSAFFFGAGICLLGWGLFRSWERRAAV